MRGIFWWNKKLDSSWETMEGDTSPFKGKHKPRARKSGKRDSKYPKLHRHVKPHDERFEAPSSEIVGTIIICVCIGLMAIFFLILARENLLYFAIFAAPATIVTLFIGIRWKLKHKTSWKKKKDDSARK